MVGELLERVADEQNLVEAWQETRRRARERGQLGSEHAAFAHMAASRLSDLSESLRDGSWSPSPARAATIPKGSGGTRELGIPTLTDSIVERAILHVIDPIIDRELLPWSFAYRRGLGVDDAIRALLEARDEQDKQWVARLDFSDCFATIPTAPLIQRISEILDDQELVDLLTAIIRRPLDGLDRDADIGLLQGAPLSPLFANLHLDRFDRAMLARDHVVIRYGDDLAIPVTTQDDAHAATRWAQQEATALGLDISARKATVSSFADGVAFLGQTLTEGTASKTPQQARPKATTIFISESEGLLRSRGDRLRYERDGELEFSLSFKRVRQIVVFGRVGCTTPFLHQVMARGIELVFLSQHGRYIGRIQGSGSSDAEPRRRQYEVARQPARSLDLARRIVVAKIVNLRGGLLRATRRASRGDVDHVLKRMRKRVDEVESAESVQEALGIEGAASRDYFEGLRSLIDAEWGFTARRRRPPPDPVNSLLSFGYTLLLQETTAAAEVAGLDPYQGFLHQQRSGRPSLALDLMEEVRPVLVDSTVLRALSTGQLRGEHFETDPGPPQRCTLTAEGRRVFLAAYERRLLTLFTHAGSGRRVSYRVGLSLQAQALAAELRGQGRYDPLVWK